MKARRPLSVRFCEDDPTPWRRLPALALLLAVAFVAAGCSDDGGEAVDGAGSAPTFTQDATVLAVIGDAGELSDDTLAVAALVERAGATEVFTVGDNEYTTEGRTVEAYEESVGGVYRRWLDAGSFHPIPGDHDYGDACDDEDAAADLDAYLTYFDLPAGPEDGTYYDVVIGDVHVFTIDSLIDCHRDGGAKLQRQQRWLAETASASEAAVKIVLTHNPPYSSGTSHGSFEALRWNYGAWGIDLVVSGDDHIYERADHDGVIYVVNGLGGVEAHEPGDPIAGSDKLFADGFGALFIGSTDEGAEASFVTVDGREIDRFVVAGSPTEPDDTTVGGGPPVSLSAESSWYWQLQGLPEAPYPFDVYDVDLFQVTPGFIGDVHDAGGLVVCYFSAGSYEQWRPDADGFASEDIGDPLDGFEDERWLDVRRDSVMAVATGRLDQAAAAGCDGVEPDNVDGHGNDTGFELTGDDQLRFNRFLAASAHERGLIIGLKNDLENIPALVDLYDFAVNEQCHEFDECDVYRPFLAADKPVFNAEYADEVIDDPDRVCAAARAAGLRTLLLPLDLDGSFRVSCDEG